MDLKKEDQDYIDSQINKKSKIDKSDYYKKQNLTVLILSFAGLILAAILGILFTPLDGRINIFMLLIIGVLLAFSSTYIVSSIILGILSIFFKKLKQNYIKFIIKILVSSATTVIAVVILVIVFSSIPPTGPGKPADATKSLLKTQINTPGREQCTAPVMFTIQNPQLSAEGIRIDTGLEPEQIIFINPQEITGFEVSNPQLLKYTLTSSKKVIMCAICSDYGKEALEQALIANGVPTTINSTIAEKTLCAVYPKKEH